MLNFGASKPRVRGGPGPRAPPGSASGFTSDLVKIVTELTLPLFLTFNNNVKAYLAVINYFK